MSPSNGRPPPRAPLAASARARRHTTSSSVAPQSACQRPSLGSRCGWTSPSATPRARGLDHGEHDQRRVAGLEPAAHRRSSSSSARQPAPGDAAPGPAEVGDRRQPAFSAPATGPVGDRARARTRSRPPARGARARSQRGFLGWGSSRAEPRSIGTTAAAAAANGADRETIRRTSPRRRPRRRGSPARTAGPERRHRAAAVRDLRDDLVERGARVVEVRPHRAARPGLRERVASPAPGAREHGLAVRRVARGAAPRRRLAAPARRLGRRGRGGLVVSATAPGADEPEHAEDQGEGDDVSRHAREPTPCDSVQTSPDEATATRR